MKNDAVSPDEIVSPRATQDAVIEKSRSNRHEVEKLRARNAHLEAALARLASTAEIIAHKTEAEGQRRNVNDAVREALITSLQSDNKQLLVRIDKDALQLATAEDRLRDLSTELILAHEKEQRRIAREMHDELGQDLTALKLLVGRGRSVNGEQAKELLGEAGAIAEGLLEKVRDICGRLRPQVLDDLGLIAGLSVHLKNFGSRSGLSIEFNHGAIEEQRLSPIVQSVVFRVIQEAVTNVARHAKTQRAEIRVEMDGEDLVFSVADGGCGFDAEIVRNVASNGLSGMAERILLVNGSCEIVSAPDTGTTVKARIPLGAAIKGANVS
jgi:signal transduction histidine kinase